MKNITTATSGDSWTTWSGVNAIQVIVGFEKANEPVRSTGSEWFSILLMCFAA